jgi:hypothetical protein
LSIIGNAPVEFTGHLITAGKINFFFIIYRAEGTLRSGDKPTYRPGV